VRACLLANVSSGKSNITIYPLVPLISPVGSPLNLHFFFFFQTHLLDLAEFEKQKT
jgi:hypothetical protein